MGAAILHGTPLPGENRTVHFGPLFLPPLLLKESMDSLQFSETLIKALGGLRVPYWEGNYPFAERLTAETR